MHRKIFSAEGICPNALISVWGQARATDRERETRSYENDSEEKRVLPPDLIVSGELLTVSFQPREWAKLLSSLTSSPFRKSLPAPAKKTTTHVEFMSSERGDNKAFLRPVRYETSYTTGQMIRVQMSAEASRGLLEPNVELVQVAKNLTLCTKHVRDPAKVLTKLATISTRERHFHNVDDYLQAWMPLIEMEAAVNAGDARSAVIVQAVKVRMLDDTHGQFRIGDTICIERNIGIGGKAPDSLQQEEDQQCLGFPLDYLCLRFDIECPATVMSRIASSAVPEVVDKHFTWLAHGAVTRVWHKDGPVPRNARAQAPAARKKQKGKDKTGRSGLPDTPQTGMMVVDFQLTHTSPTPPDDLLASKDGEVMTVEILAKSEVERLVTLVFLLCGNPANPPVYKLTFNFYIDKMFRCGNVLFTFPFVLFGIDGLSSHLNDTLFRIVCFWC
jgi:hypothetical protein